MEISLRPFRPDDKDVLFAIYAGTRQQEMAAWGWNALQQETFLRMQFGAQSQSYDAAYPDASHRIICAGERAIGRILVHRDAGFLLLVDIALLPEFRGQGIGTRFLHELLKEAESSHLPVRLHVQKTNIGALRLYQRLGFLKTGEDEIYWQMERPPV
jgi:ribosomal protein S18 acetylase RimI-like enzyme